MSAIGLILLTPDLFSKLVIVKADLDTVPEAPGMEVISPLDFKEKPNCICGQIARFKGCTFSMIGTYLVGMDKMLKKYILNEWIYTAEGNLHFLIKLLKIILCLRFLGVWGSWEFKVE